MKRTCVFLQLHSQSQHKFIILFLQVCPISCSSLSSRLLQSLCDSNQLNAESLVRKNELLSVSIRLDCYMQEVWGKPEQELLCSIPPTHKLQRSWNAFHVDLYRKCLLQDKKGCLQSSWHDLHGMSSCDFSLCSSCKNGAVIDSIEKLSVCLTFIKLCSGFGGKLFEISWHRKMIFYDFTKRPDVRDLISEKTESRALKK